MANAIIDTFELWTTAQNLKTSNRGLSASNQSLLGIKKLRELILELAVRGKLVPQDPNDEPANILLNKIEVEKKLLFKDGTIKMQEELPGVSDNEMQFELPKGWGWTRLGNLSADIHYGFTASANSQISTVRLLRITDIQDDKVNWNSVPGCEIETKQIDNYRLENGDILIARTGGTIGKSYLVSDIRLCSVFASYLIRVKKLKETYPHFIKVYLGSLFYWNQLYANSMGTGQPNVNGNALKKLVFALPPLAEQHRIVAKVDELMALCDQLEQQQTSSNEAHQTLVDTLFGTLTSAESPAAFEEAWQRIANHFDTLLTTEHSLDQLKQTILQLAVMGKLVPQNPEDEPASELLKKIKKEKERLVKEGKIKKQPSLSEITNEEKPFELPDGWEFIRLEAISSLITKGSSPKWQGVSYTENQNDVLFVTSENVGSYELIFDNKKFVEMKFNEIEPRSILKKGDYLMNIVGGSIGRTAIYDIDNLANINQAVCLIRILPGWLERQFLLHFFNSHICVSYMFDKQVDNARANLSMGNISKFVIPVPPLDEQYRIVSKVDELFALCDALKERLRDAQALQNKLAVAAVERAV